MEEIIDKIIEEIKLMNAVDHMDGGIADFLELTDVKWDDPGLVLLDEYPYAFVAPAFDENKHETVGRVGYDVRNNLISVVFVINQSDYFDPTVSEVPGSRLLVRAARNLRRWLRRKDKIQLGGLARNIVVQSANYVPDVRGEAFVRTAIITLLVESQDQHQ